MTPRRAGLLIGRIVVNDFGHLTIDRDIDLGSGNAAFDADALRAGVQVDDLLGGHFGAGHSGADDQGEGGGEKNLFHGGSFRVVPIPLFGAADCARCRCGADDPT